MLFLIIIAVESLYCITSELNIPGPLLLEVIYLPLPLGLWLECGSVNDDGVTHLPFISSRSFFLCFSPFCQSTPRCEKKEEPWVLSWVYSALGTSPTSINVFPVPLLCGHLSNPALCPRAGFPDVCLFIAWHRLGTHWRRVVGQQVYAGPPVPPSSLPGVLSASLPPMWGQSPTSCTVGVCWSITACNGHWAGSLLEAQDVPGVVESWGSVSHTLVGEARWGLRRK